MIAQLATTDLLAGTLFDIRRYSVNDGPGIRTTLFFKGCPLSCWWCHNPESQSPEPQLWQRPGRCIRCGSCVTACEEGAIKLTPKGPVTRMEKCTACGRCAIACPSEARELAGRRYTLDEVLAEIERDRAFYDESGGGVTFSGGEPLLQRRFLLGLLQACCEREIHTTLDTCGYAAWEVVESVLPYVDLFYYDLKHMDSARHQELTGVPNELILANLGKLARRGARLVLRLPVVPGANDEDENWQRMAQFAAALPGVERVDLLPYHHIALGKYNRLGLPYHLPEARPPSPERLEQVAAPFKQYGLTVKIS